MGYVKVYRRGTVKATGKDKGHFVKVPSLALVVFYRNITVSLIVL